MTTEKGGQPTKMTEITLKVLKKCFLNDATDKQACLEAGITPTTLYNYQEKHPEYLELKTLWKENVKLKAKQNLVDKIQEGDTDVSKWYSERRAKEEFSIRQELTGADGEEIGVVILPSKEIQDDKPTV